MFCMLFPSLRRRLLLVSRTLSRFTDCHAGGLLALFVLEVDSRNGKAVPGENIWCLSLARQSRKRSNSERRQSEFNDRVHLIIFFCERVLAPTQGETPAACKTLKKNRCGWNRPP